MCTQCQSNGPKAGRFSCSRVKLASCQRTKIAHRSSVGVWGRRQRDAVGRCIADIAMSCDRLGLSPYGIYRAFSWAFFNHAWSTLLASCTWRVTKPVRSILLSPVDAATLVGMDAHHAGSSNACCMDARCRANWKIRFFSNSRLTTV